jgi:7-carboxy-7-deazaguanine synthase
MSAATDSPVLPAASERRLRLKLTEIFLSLQGEANAVGWPTVFVRLTGCPLRCQYCDTPYAFHGGEWTALDDVVAKVDSFGVRHVCVTGGEPLAQRSVHPLLKTLCDRGYDVSIETSGALDIGDIDTRVTRVVDVKTPASGEAHRNRLENLSVLRSGDQVKFVICSREDYEWSRALVADRSLTSRCMVLFSPAFGQVEPRSLAEWIIADRLGVRFQLQLHKVLWGDMPGR